MAGGAGGAGDLVAFKVVAAERGCVPDTTPATLGYIKL